MPAIFLILLMTCTLFAVCTGSSLGAKAEKKVVIGASSDPETLSPYSSLYGDRYAMLSMVYQPLVCVVGNKAYNVMITDYKEVGKNIYDCYLYKNIYDTAGNHFTAKDAVFSYKTAIDSGNFSTLNSVTSVTALNDYTIEFKCNDSLVFGQITTILSQVFMVTEAAYKASSDKMAVDPVGTTGYVLDQYVQGSRVIFKKAKRAYWQKAKEGETGYVFLYDTTKVDKVEYHFITDSTQTVMALKTGSIDIANRISKTDLTMLQKDKFKFYAFTGEHYTATFNCSEKSVCSNVNMRKALTYSWDTKGIISGALDGDGEIATGLNNRYRLDYDPKYNKKAYFGYNVSLAKQYLKKYYAETGKAANDVSITILVVNDPYLEKVAQIMQAYIMKLGVKCKVASYDSVTRKTIRNSEQGWDIAVAKSIATEMYNVANVDMQFNVEKGKTLAGGWINDAHLQELVIEACATKTHSVNTMSALEDYMRDQCYVVGLIIDKIHVASDKMVTKLITGPYGYVAPCACTYNWSAKKG